jgi:hypothetical protein
MLGASVSEMSAEYSSCSAVMAELLGEIAGQDYSIPKGRIPLGILDGAKELFGLAINVMNGQPINPVEEATAYALVIEHLRKTDPKKYDGQGFEKSRLLYRRDIRSLASLLDNLGLPKVPEDQREYVPILQKFFKLLLETGDGGWGPRES